MIMLSLHGLAGTASITSRAAPPAAQTPWPPANWDAADACAAADILDEIRARELQAALDEVFSCQPGQFHPLLQRFSIKCYH